ARPRSLERPRDRERGEEDPGQQVSAPEAPAPVPVRIPAHADEEEGEAADDQPPVGAGGAALAPADEAEHRPGEKRGEEEPAARRVEEVRERDPRARNPESEDAAPGELRVLGRGLARGGERPRRAEADRVVPREQRDRDRRAEGVGREPARRAPRRRAD